jgi:hypothetical protein
VEKLRTAGFNGCVAKPVDLDSFPDMVQRFLDGETLWRVLH